MSTILYYSRNPNPRLAVATARYLNADLAFEWAAPFDPAQSDRFRALNPGLSIPILVEHGQSLWEADAIACRLSMKAKSDFWRMGADMPDMIRWISWGKANFVMACDMVHFEFGTKQRYGMGSVDASEVGKGRSQFAQAATLLDAQLKGRDFLLDSGVSYADFRMASFLPFNDVAGLPVQDYAAISAWYGRICAIPAWSDPFAGLNPPDLPAIERQI